MIEFAKFVLLAFVFIHTMEAFLADARRRRRVPMDRHRMTLRAKLIFVLALALWFAIRLAPSVYSGVELMEYVS